MIYPVISIRQPWAALIVNGIKNIENRNWRLPAKFRNCTVLVHASAKPRFSIAAVHGELTRRGYAVTGDIYSLTTKTGAIIGALRFSGDLLAYDHIAPSEWADKDTSHRKLHWWMIDKAQVLPPIPAQGKLRFWQFDYPYPITWVENEHGPRC